MKVLQIKITLNGSKPSIWRRVEITDDATFADLHRAIRDVMGWDGYHLHEFAFEGKGTKIPQLIGRPSAESMIDVHDEDKELVKEWLGVKRKQCIYTYDFGDSWDHTVHLEAIIDSEEGVSYPRCTGGKRACPPEDSGGIWGYASKLEILQDPKHANYEEVLEWMGEDWDSDTFDADDVVFSHEADFDFDGQEALPITTVDEALDELDDPSGPIPFEAIEFLRNAQTTQELLERICFVLENAYVDMGFDDEGFCTEAPLWYAVVAEAHLDRSLIKPTVRLLTSTANDWGFMNEQAQHLVCLLAEKYPDDVAKETMKAIDAAMELGIQSPYLYLFDVFQVVDAKKYETWLLACAANPNNTWVAPFAHMLADIRMVSAAKTLEAVITRLRSDKHRPKQSFYDESNDVEEALRLLQGKQKPYESMMQPEYLNRKDWKEHYKQFEDRLTDDLDEDASYPQNEPYVAPEKIGRNVPCPCGSTKSDGSPKKYKNCCGTNS